uniref:Cytochrome b5 heme-binding domain-containing protein n=1 Tax=Oryza punctata TaxID=4537 RepID=A0A0E0LUJ0_ORYPU
MYRWILGSIAQPQIGAPPRRRRRSPTIPEGAPQRRRTTGIQIRRRLSLSIPQQILLRESAGKHRSVRSNQIPYKQNLAVVTTKFSKAKEASSNAKSVTFRSYTKEEISAHNTRTDCWVIIKDKVYDVTSYVEEHPGGDAILNNAGGDSTEGFFGPQHGFRVFEIIEDFCIGELKDS